MYEFEKLFSINTRTVPFFQPTFYSSSTTTATSLITKNTKMLARQFLRHQKTLSAVAPPRLVSRTMASKAFVKYNWQDPLNLESQLTEDEVFVRDAAHAYCQEKLLPRVLEAYRNESKLLIV